MKNISSNICHKLNWAHIAKATCILASPSYNQPTNTG